MLQKCCVQNCPEQCRISQNYAKFEFRQWSCFDLCQAARRNIERAQEKQARLHDRKIKTHRYRIGDKVLLKDFCAKKMDPKWLRPYYIYDIKLNGTYKLRTLDNKLRKKLVHADQIVPYIDRTN